MNRLELHGDIRPMLLGVGLFSLAGGIQVGGRFQPSRILLSAAFLGSVFFYQKIRNSDTPIVRQFLALAVIWLAWGSLSLSWCLDPINGARELVGVLLGSLTALGVISLTVGESHLRALRVGWISAALVTMPVAAWELATGSHLPLAAERGNDIAAGGDVGFVRYAAVTFGNHNGYVAFLLLTFPAVLWWFDRARMFARVLASVLIVAIGGLVLISGSRLGLIVVLLQTFLWFGLAKPGKLKIPFGAVVGAFAVAVVVVYGIMNASYTQMRILDLLSGKDSSVGARRAQMYNSFIFTSRTFGRGLGAGSFDAGVAHWYGLYKTYDGVVLITSAHNVLLEILGNYGVIIFVLMIVLLVRCWFLLWGSFRLARRRDDVESEQMFVAGLLWLTPFPLILAINSSILTFGMMWAALGTICVLAHMATRYHREFRAEKSMARGAA